MNPNEILQYILLGMSGWTLLQVHSISVRLSVLEQQLKDLPCMNGKTPCKI